MTDLSNERNEVMFTHGKHLDVTHDHHLIMIFVKHGVVQYV